MRDSAGKRRRFKTQNDAHHVSYKRFRRRIMQRGGREGPAASTPLTTGWQCEPSFEFDTVCQRLDLDSPPRHLGSAQTALQENLQETALAKDASYCGAVTPLNTSCAFSAKEKSNVPEQGWVWRAAAQECGSAQQAGSGIRAQNLPLAVLDKATVNPQEKLVMRLAAPSLLNDYYTNLLDCSCDGIVALALGSSVYLWNSETRALVGYLDSGSQGGQQYVSSLCWSGDGRTLCFGTRRGEIQLWDVEKKQNMRCLPSHLSVVRAISWKQQLLSSGSALGRIHHLDFRASAPLIGVVAQKEGICGLQWSPGGEWLASGSTDGLLHIWGNDIAGLTRSHQPVATMKQPSAVKAVGWCPWQGNTIATGGGWKDGDLRIWDTQTGTCVTSGNTNSQICSLRWAEKKRYIVTGHGLPHHQVRLWEFPSLGLSHQLTGHSHRVLHVALNPDSSQIFSAGGDECLHIWEI